MDRSAGTRGKRYPLHVTISAAFTLLLALFGFALIGFNYLEGRKAALLSADDLLDRIEEHVRIRVEGLYAPIENIVDVASRTLPANSDDDGQGLRSLGFASEVLRIKPEISSIFVGYQDGDFYILRHVDSWSGVGHVVDVPAGTTFVLESIERGSEEPESRDWLFYDDELRLVGSSATPWEGFDPRRREWYGLAMAAEAQIATPFYRFFTSGDVGVTIARRLASNRGVVGADLTLRDLSAGLAGQQPTPSARIAMLEPDGRVIALSGEEAEIQSVLAEDVVAVRMPYLSDLADPLFDALADRLEAGERQGRLELEVVGRTWLAALSELPTRWGEPIVVATLVPREELLANVVRMRNQSLLISSALLLVTLLIVIGLARHISTSLRRLAREAEQIRELRLDTPLTVRSSIEEVDELASTMSVMKSSLQQFLNISHALSAEKQFDRLLEMILEETRRVSGAEAGAILLRSGDETLEVAILQLAKAEAGTEDHEPRRRPVSLNAGAGHDSSVEAAAAHRGAVLCIDQASGGHGYDLRGVRARFEGNGTTVRSVMCVPLLNPQDEMIGLLQLVNAPEGPGEATGFRAETVPYIEALSSDAAVALDNRRLLKAQKELLESFTQVVAGAIDAKSPYTHGHCQRVPTIARMLAEEAHTSDDGPFAGFHLNDDGWHALHLASWLHDCGKMTTPEYVVDKSSKLETIYNRIHEVRTRFEVLLRDAEIDYLRALREEDADEAALRARFKERQARIRDDFNFIARCNAGDEPMTDEMVERVREIGGIAWMRHLDDRAGLAHGELERRSEEPEAALPVEESLLADRPEHIVPRHDGGHPFGDNEHAFRMEVPEHLYNLGEIHNLCIRRGTLTAEERFKINEHVIQTIRMLGRLPFPRELRQVPDWAGTHHEKMDGTGYPRRLAAGELGVPERIMALADIFEALTAVDRPYTPPKPLSRVMGIMASMRDSGHLCPETFELFLRSGVYRRYAEEHLRPQQLDDVDEEKLLGTERRCAS